MRAATRTSSRTPPVSAGPCPQARFDWATLIRNKDAEIARLENVYRSNLVSGGVEVLDSRAVIEDAHTVRIAKTGARVRARTILVATGAHPTLEPPIPGGELGVTSNEVFHLERLPERILVIGGGYIAVEFAGIFCGLGSRVTLLHRGDKLLRGFDEDIRSSLGEAYARRGIDLRLGRTVERLERRGDAIAAILSDGAELVVDEVLAAIGRRPNTAGLGLETAGIEVDRAGAIPVDGYSRTLTPSIYAVGDVTNRANLTPIAIREGHAFADTVFGDKPTIVDHSLIPTAVFSTPEIGVIGMSEATARLRGEVAIYKTSFRAMKATLSGPRRARLHEAHRRRRLRQGARRPHHGGGRGRDHPGRRHRRHHGRHEGRFRPHHRGPPDGLGGARHHAHAVRGEAPAGGGVTASPRFAGRGGLAKRAGEGPGERGACPGPLTLAPLRYARLVPSARGPLPASGER